MVNGSKKKNREFPHMFVLLLAVIIVATVSTYIVPAGQYARVIDENTGREVIDPASFQYLDRTQLAC